MNVAEVMMTVMTYRGSKFVHGLLLARASYCYTLAHGLGRIYALQGAIELCWRHWWKRSV